MIRNKKEELFTCGFKNDECNKNGLNFLAYDLIMISISVLKMMISISVLKRFISMNNEIVSTESSSFCLHSIQSHMNNIQEITVILFDSKLAVRLVLDLNHLF